MNKKKQVEYTFRSLPSAQQTKKRQPAPFDKDCRNSDKRSGECERAKGLAFWYQRSSGKRRNRRSGLQFCAVPGRCTCAQNRTPITPSLLSHLDYHSLPSQTSRLPPLRTAAIRVPDSGKTNTHRSLDKYSTGKLAKAVTNPALPSPETRGANAPWDASSPGRAAPGSHLCIVEGVLE